MGIGRVDRDPESRDAGGDTEHIRPVAGANARDAYAEPPHRSRAVLVLSIVAGVLALALALGGGYAYVELDDRADTIRERERTIGQLTEANQGLENRNQDLQNQVNQLTGERDQLDAQVAELQTQVGDLEDDVAEKNRQLSQARAEGSQQQDRAESAEAIGGVLLQIIQIDDQINKEYQVLIGYMADILDAYDRNDARAFNVAAAGAQAAAQRLDNLFAQRDQVIAQLQ